MQRQVQQNVGLVLTQPRKTVKKGVFADNRLLKQVHYDFVAVIFSDVAQTYERSLGLKIRVNYMALRRKNPAKAVTQDITSPALMSSSIKGHLPLRSSSKVPQELMLTYTK